MSLLVKSEIVCNTCKLILRDSVTLPCSSDICGEHLRDGTVKNGVITCEKNFDVPRIGFAPNFELANLLASKSHLSNEEKTTKRAIQDLIHQLEELQHLVITSTKPEMELTTFEHFTEIRRQIDIQREELKRKIDEIALKLIDQTKKREEIYKSKLKEIISPIVNTDLATFTQLMANEFRRPNLLIEEAERLKNEHVHKLAEFKAKLKEFSSLGKEIKSIEFEPRLNFQEIEFGRLKFKDSLLAFTLNNEIQIWNINSSKCVATLEGHSDSIECLENVDENIFASGSKDNTIRIWDSKKFVCLNTLRGHQYGIICIKNLTANRIASGSCLYIKIWDIESGECLQTLNGHAGGIYGLVYLPNGNLASCSNDTTIKVWDLVRGECIQTL